MSSLEAGPIRVLHVDDEPDFAELAARFVEREDDRIDVETATGADEGMERLADGGVDCIVSDYDMPGCNGIEFLEAVRSEYPDLPFILFTGKGSEAVASDAISSGATDYLQKGTGAEQYELLANRIGNVVAQYRSRRAQQRLLDLAENTDRVISMFSDDWSELLFASAAYEELWGRSLDDLRADPEDFLRGIHPDDRPSARDAMDCISDGEAVDFEVRVNDDEAYRRWARVHGEPITDDSGAVVRVGVFAADVTEDQRMRERRQRQRARLVELTTDDAVTEGDFERAVRRVTEAGAEVLAADRVNVWLADDDGERLRCVDCYDRRTGEHTHGTELATAECPRYFAALESNQAVAVTDARSDPRTAELAEDYLDPYGVGALLDGTLRLEGEVVGMVCHEHVGDSREWTDAEVEFVSEVADVVHRALRNRDQRERQREWERTSTLLSTLVGTLPVGVLAVDESGRVLRANDRLVDLLGLSETPDDLAGADSTDLTAEMAERFVDPEAFVRRVGKLVDSGTPARDAGLALRDGRTLDRRYEPVAFADGEGHLWVYRDGAGTD